MPTMPASVLPSIVLPVTVTGPSVVDAAAMVAELPSIVLPPVTVRVPYTL